MLDFLGWLLIFVTLCGIEDTLGKILVELRKRELSTEEVTK